MNPDGTTVDEIAPDVFRFSTFLDPPGLAFNQYLVRGEDPLLFHTGHRMLFGSVREALSRVLDPGRLRWISFGHLEADECGAMNEWLSVAPRAEVTHGELGVRLSLNDMADRPPRTLAEGERLDLGGRVVRWIGTAHVPHGWDSGLLIEETTGTLLCGDLFTRLGRTGPVEDTDPVGPALELEDLMHATALTPRTAPAIRALADLAPSTLGLMHGPAYTGDAVAALEQLAGGYSERMRRELELTGG
jgi:flavorubredoxin